MTLVENLQSWKEAVECYNKGDFQCSLNKFKNMNDTSAKIAFNIGRSYLSLCDLQAASQAFQEVVKKDEHLAVGHFMLGVVNLMCARHSEALVNFNETFRNLRESKFIDYRQLGMRYKLYKCEVLLNRAVCLSSLGYIDSAVEDLLAALQCKVEPRHSIIDVSLNTLQSGQGVEFLVMDAIFQPPKSKTANLEKRDYLGKSQVVVDTSAYETMETPLHLRGQLNASATMHDESGERYRVLYDFTGQHADEVSVKAGDIITIIDTAEDGWYTMATNDSRKKGLVPGSYVEKYNDEKQETVTSRQALLKDLRKKETRQSLRRVPPSLNIQTNKPFKNKDRHSSALESNQTYANGFNSSSLKERPKTVELGGLIGGLGKSSPKLPQTDLNRQGPPKFRRNISAENILGKKSPKSSPTIRKKSVDSNIPKRRETNNNGYDANVDDDGYEEVPEITPVKPYAIHDVMSSSERKTLNGRKGPERPAPPPKVTTTMKARGFPPPTVAPRVPRANTVSALGFAMGQKIALGQPSSIPKSTKKMPKVPPSSLRHPRKDTDTTGKEVKTVSLEFIVATSLNVSASTNPEDIQNAAREAINRNTPSYLWCEKDGKRIRLDDIHRASNILDLVQDGKLKIWCNP